MHNFPAIGSMWRPHCPSSLLQTTIQNKYYFNSRFLINNKNRENPLTCSGSIGVWPKTMGQGQLVSRPGSGWTTQNRESLIVASTAASATFLFLCNSFLIYILILPSDITIIKVLVFYRME